METDSLFYRLFSEKPKLLFELLGEKIPRTTYTFGSYEIKQTSLRADGILHPDRPKAQSSSLRLKATAIAKTKSIPVSSPKFSCTCVSKHL